MRHYLIVIVGLFLILPGFSNANPTLKGFDANATEYNSHFGQNKWSVVMIWAHDCSVCNEEASAYMDFHLKNKNLLAKVIGISIDGEKYKSEAKAFLARHKLTFPNYYGEAQEIANWFYELTGANWRGTPTFLIYNPKGDLLAQQAGAIPVPLLEQFIAQNGKFN